MKIARCLATNSYRAVYVPTKEDLAVKEYVRMRDEHKLELKRIKQKILGFCLRHGFVFTEGKSYWTLKHMAWLENLKPDAMLREVLDEYLLTYRTLLERLETFDKRIEEISKAERYAEKVRIQVLIFKNKILVKNLRILERNFGATVGSVICFRLQVTRK